MQRSKYSFPRKMFTLQVVSGGNARRVLLLYIQQLAGSRRDYVTNQEFENGTTAASGVDLC